MKKYSQPLEKEDIIKIIKNNIISGKWEPTERIIELKLSKELNCPRAKVREGLRQLEQEGFVNIIPNVGTVVSKLSRKDIVQIYDLMGVLEGLSIRVATPFVSKTTLEQIEILVVKVEEKKNDPFLMSQNNFKFHVFLTELCGNKRLIQFMENIRLQTHRMRLQPFFAEEQVEATIKEHRKILKAIIEKNRSNLFESITRMRKSDL